MAPPKGAAESLAVAVAAAGVEADVVVAAVVAGLAALNNDGFSGAVVAAGVAAVKDGAPPKRPPAGFAGSEVAGAAAGLLPKSPPVEAPVAGVEELPPAALANRLGAAAEVVVVVFAASPEEAAGLANSVLTGAAGVDESVAAGLAPNKEVEVAVAAGVVLESVLGAAGFKPPKRPPAPAGFGSSFF